MCKNPEVTVFSVKCSRTYFINNWHVTICFFPFISANILYSLIMVNNLRVHMRKRYEWQIIRKWEIIICHRKNIKSIICLASARKNPFSVTKMHSSFIINELLIVRPFSSNWEKFEMMVDQKSSKLKNSIQTK